MIECPKCSSPVNSESINIQTDIAQCLQCQNIFKISLNIENLVDPKFNINKQPSGTWLKKEFNQTIIGATTRSPVAFFLVPFMLIWSGGSLGGIYGSQIIDGEFDLLLSLFGIPFLIGSIIFWTITLMAIAGKVEITIDKDGGKVFTGVGQLGIIKRFSWDEISKIKEGNSKLTYPGSQGGVIVLEGTRKISFGLGVKENRKYYLLNALRSIAKKYQS